MGRKVRLRKGRRGWGRGDVQGLGPGRRGARDPTPSSLSSDPPPPETPTPKRFPRPQTVHNILRPSHAVHPPCRTRFRAFALWLTKSPRWPFSQPPLFSFYPPFRSDCSWDLPLRGSAGDLPTEPPGLSFSSTPPRRRSCRPSTDLGTGPETPRQLNLATSYPWDRRSGTPSISAFSLMPHGPSTTEIQVSLHQPFRPHCPPSSFRLYGHTRGPVLSTPESSVLRGHRRATNRHPRLNHTRVSSVTNLTCPGHGPPL